jgi:membrane protein
MKKLMERLYDYFARDLWEGDRSSSGGLHALLVGALRIVTVVVRDVMYGEITLRATGLVYSTLLSLVPLLAVSFSVLKAFGVHNALEPFLLNLLTPLGSTAADLAQRIVGFVNNMKVGVLGLVGLGLLIYTVVALIQKVEEAFNVIWRVRSSRSILQRFSDYLSVVLVGPVLVASALGLTASLMSTTLMQKLVAVGPISDLVFAAGKLLPYVLVCAAFAFIYVFVPNTKVRFFPAVTGAVIGGVLWETVGWGFASFIVASTQYGAVYSGFAALILFMLWLYLSWLILLVGAEVAFYCQNPQYLRISGNGWIPDARLIEQTALAVMFLVSRSFHIDGQPWTVNLLAQRLGLSPERVGEIVDALKKSRLIAETAENPPALLPARDPGTIALRDVYEAVRGSGSGKTGQSIARIDAVESIAASVEEAIGGSLDGTTIGDLVRSPGNAYEDTKAGR